MKRVAVVVALAIGLVGGAAIAHAATSFTAPKDHAQAYVHTNNLGQWVATNQRGFQDISHVSTGHWCFLLPLNADPSRSVYEATLVGNVIGVEIYWNPDSVGC